MSNYALTTENKGHAQNLGTSLKTFLPLLSNQRVRIAIATLAAFLNAGLNLLAPVLMGYAVDTAITHGNFQELLGYSGWILLIYIGSVIAGYFQTLLMGRVGQHLLFTLRGNLFQKIQSLPVAFFNQNKAGDLISRINNDTDKLNQFFSQSLVQFVANIVTIIGAAAFVLYLNPELGSIAVIPAVVLLLFTQVISPWIRRKNAASLKTTGGMSGEVSESIDNFKVVVAFNRRDYFKKRFEEVNEANYASAVGAGIANTTLTPTYGLAASIAQLAVIIYGIAAIQTGAFTLGLLISFLTYVSRIYDPLRQIAALWANFQTAFASWDRIHAILKLDSNLTSAAGMPGDTRYIMEFKDVSFGYPGGKEVLHKINLSFEKGKTYALVGPTGGGKTTTASLIARLYDPTSGSVLLDGRDIRSWSDAERSQKIGFILQEPFLFTGTVRENIVYGNEKYYALSNEELLAVITEHGLEMLLTRFEEGLDTKVTATGSKLSLGQKQLIAFIRAVLREPELIILDEATANIDTVTEQILDEILKRLPGNTTLVVIAHRLNTIENADEIYFVNSGEVTRAGSMEHALEMLLHGKRES